MLGLSPQWTLRLAFVTSMFAAIISGLELAFNVYALPLKETMNFTQTQVEVIASMGTIGMALSCLETIITCFFGYKVTCLVVVTLFPASSAIFALLVRYNQIFHSWPSVVCLTQLIMGTTNSVAYVALSRVCVELMPKKHTGKLVGLYLALCCSGKIYFAGKMELFFTDNLAGFFLSTAVVSVVTYGICFTLLCEVSTIESGYSALESETPILENEEEGKDISSRNMLKSPFFHATFWPSGVFYGWGYTCVNNLTSFAHTSGVSDPLITVFLLSVVIVVIRVTYGTIFDKFSSLPCGFAMMLISYAASIAVAIIGMFYLDKNFMFLLTIFIGIGMAPGLTIPVSMLLLRFGRLHYSAITGCFYSVSGICQIFLQIMVGFFYDREVEKQALSDWKCVGRNCFFWAFAILLCSSVVIFLSQIINSLSFSHTFYKRET